VTVRAIVRFPDPRLRHAAEPVQHFDASLRALVDDLHDTMLAAPGIGITGPHIGVAQRVVVIRLSAGEPMRAYVNPMVVWASE
jgi:peptide deformylase